MEKKIKTLYILSISAIVTFLAMQVYWLYTRYEYTLCESENEALHTMEDAVEEYATIRANSSHGTGMRHMSNYNVDYGSNGDIRSVRATVKTITYNSHEMLGIKESRELTSEEKKRAAKMMLDCVDGVDSVVHTYETVNAPSCGAVWNAMRNAEGDYISPFTEAGIDSVLSRFGLRTDVKLAVTDTMEWEPTIIRHKSLFSPEMTVSIPYSELDCKSVVITHHIPIEDVMKKMAVALVLAVAISVLLIICLIWQVVTIVRFNRLDIMRNSFVSTMIHELKRPISTLKMCVSGLDNDVMMSDAETRRGLLSETRTALDNLSAYFSKLRDITFNNTEQIPLNITSFNLSETFDSVITSSVIPSGKDVVFRNNMARDINISADRSHIFNIMTNLVENAVKYSSDRVEITADAIVDDSAVRIVIEDTGHGIPNSDLKHIFTRFYRGEVSAGEQPGMGLGLSYVKLLAEAHGGRVEVVSEIGEGSRFTIILPQ